jgi:hypothetical protein
MGRILGRPEKLRPRLPTDESDARPEGRACSRPTARRVIDLFEDVQRHELTEGRRAAVVFTTNLTRLQRKILRLLGMPRAYNG